MAFPRIRALGALLAAFSTSTFSTSSTVFSDSPNQPSDPRHPQSLVSDPKSAPPDAPPPPPPPSRQPPQYDAAHARRILDRYYSISADAISSQTQTPTVPKPHNHSPRRVRRPAHAVFADLEPQSFDGPACNKFIIVGGGTAAWSAIDAILEVDPSHAPHILLLTEEPHLPYNRTVLSKELWSGNHRDAFRDLEAAKSAVEYGYRHARQDKVHVVRGTRVTSLDVFTKAIWLADGTRLHYDKLLLATGGVPRLPATVSHFLKNPGIEERVTVFRTLDDFRNLRSRLESGGSAIVIGGGFLGTELALAIKQLTDEVTLVVAEPGILFRVLPRYLCQFLARRFSEVGVNVVTSAVMTNAVNNDKGVALTLTSPDADKVSASEVVVAVGIAPDVELAKTAGLELDVDNGGIQVNDFMMAEPDVFAAGDVASFHDRSLGRRRVEHWDHAVVTGRIAGQNMVGGRSRYGLQSMFWSDLDAIDVSFTAVGLVDSSLATVAVWNTATKAIDGAPSANQFSSGVVYYVKNDQVVGAVLWNPRRGSGALRRARALISAKTRLEEMDDITLAKLVNLEDGEHRTVIRTAAP